MELIVFGLNHKTAPVSVREKLALNENQVQLLDSLFVQDSDIEEAYILSTCNRTEFHLMVNEEQEGHGVYNVVNDAKESHGNNGKDIDQRLMGKLTSKLNRIGNESLNISFKDLRPHFYFMKNDEGIAHIFRVASGLNSLVTGETEILGQVKKAYQLADKAGSIGVVLHALYQQALSVGKRIHRETGINNNAASISYAAVKLAQKIFGHLSNKKIMLIGAGLISELTARHLASQGIVEMVVLNRTIERAEKIANKFQAKAVSYSQLSDWLPEVDIIISSTGAPHHIITKSMITRAMKKRKYAPIFLIDIAVPRDVEPRVNEIESAYLYCIDDLEAVVNSNYEERKKEAAKAEMVIQEEVTEFLTWYKSRDVVPLISALRDKAEQIRQAELQRYDEQLKNFSKKERKTVENITRCIMNRLLKEPVLKIKKYAVTDQEDLYGATLAHLFDLGEDVIPRGEKDYLASSRLLKITAEKNQTGRDYHDD